MRSDPSGLEVRSTPYRRAGGRWFFLLTAVAFGMVAAAVIISLRNVADDNRHAQLSLAVFEQRMYELSALEWQAIAQRSVGPELRSKIMRTRRAMTSDLAEATRLAPQQIGLWRVATYHDRYMMAVEEEIRLLDAGRVAEARDVDERMVDPSFETLKRAVDESGAVNSALAEERIRDSERTSVLAIVAALAIIAVLLWRFDPAEYASRMSEIEKNVLRASEERFRSLVQNSSDVVLIVEEDGVLRYASAAAYRVIGRRPEALVDTRILDRVHEDDVAQVKSFLAESARDTSSKPTVEFRFRHGDGRWIYIQAIGSNSLEDPSVGGIVMNCRDTSDRRRLEEKLRSPSLRDDLTGLHNRRGFFTLAQQQLKAAARANRELFLLFAELDDMKHINDTLGHRAGDQALREIADVLRQTFRESDIIARMGGDEFAVLGEQPLNFPVGLLPARLQGYLDRRNAGDKDKYPLTLSVGVVGGKATPDATIDDVLAAADAQMYAANRRKLKSA